MTGWVVARAGTFFGAADIQGANVTTSLARVAWSIPAIASAKARGAACGVCLTTALYSQVTGHRSQGTARDPRHADRVHGDPVTVVMPTAIMCSQHFAGNVSINHVDCRQGRRRLNFSQCQAPLEPKNSSWQLQNAT